MANQSEVKTSTAHDAASAVRFIVMRRALKSALPWLRMIAGEDGRPSTSAIHSVVREVEAAIETARA